jgi:hypothetical protein
LLSCVGNMLRGKKYCDSKPLKGVSGGGKALQL